MSITPRRELYLRDISADLYRPVIATGDVMTGGSPGPAPSTPSVVSSSASSTGWILLLPLRLSIKRDHDYNMQTLKGI